MRPELVEASQEGALDVMLRFGFGMELWSIQRRIARAIAQPHARVAVPSCNSSGKTAVGGAIALGFYASYDHVKVVTTSPREGQLRDNLWGEIRRFGNQRRYDFPGRIPDSGMRISSGRRLMVGVSPAEVEGLKGYHAPNVLVVVDEAAALEHDMAGGLNTLLASGDARILLLFNPSDSNTWAAEVCEAGGFEVIRIRAWDTPLLASMSNQQIRERWGVELEPERVPRSEPVPSGADLMSPRYLDNLVADGKGPGSYEWQTSVEAQFWEMGTDTVVPKEWYDKARTRTGAEGQTVLGVDIASYGDSESVVAVRSGNRLVALHAFSGLRADHFWQDSVAPLVRKYQPRFVVWDADGVGAGSYTDAAAACGKAALPFRGSHPMSVDYLNMRSLHYWNLHRRFEWGDIAVAIDDTTLRKQLTSVTYQRRGGKIAIDGKQQMRTRGIRHLDRADAVMYAFSCDPPDPKAQKLTEEDVGMRDAGQDMFWERRERSMKRRVLPRSPMRASVR